MLFVLEKRKRKEEMVLEDGVKRWLVDISEWEPSPQDFSAALSSLPQHDHLSITRFLKLDDRKRALVSRLLQYSLLHQVLKIPFQDILIKRTFEGKPYLEGDYNNKTLDFPNFNFNVSHHGDYVAIASEPISLIGVDIVAPSSTPGNKQTTTVPEFISSFTSYFSTLEWSNIVTATNHDQMLSNFYRYWCLKESYVKAIGKGVGERLDNVEFHHNCWNNIYVKVDGTILNDWKFWLSTLHKNHFIAIARGNPNAATNSYKRTLKKIQFDQDECKCGLLLPNTSFELLKVEQLIIRMDSQ